MASEKKLAKSTAIVSSGILTSRILGFIRDVLIAKFFGAKIFAEAFVMAFAIPNALRQLVAEGAVDSVLVPILTEYRIKKSKAEFLSLANILLNSFLLILLLITIIGILISPLLVRMIALGFADDPYKLSLTIDLTQILFPYILLVGLTAYCAGILNTFRRFAAPAYATAVWNATVILAMLIFYRSFNIVYLVFAVLAGGVLELLIQFFPLSKIGRFFNIRTGFMHEAAKRVGKLLLPRVIGAGVYQINIIVDKMLASFQLIVGKGAVAALYYGNRIFQLPLALFAISIATAALPTMSSSVAEKDLSKLRMTISFSMRNMLFLCLPASMGLMVLSRPIIKVVFERGEFSPYATDITSSVLFFYAIGLVAYGGVKILVSAFHAMQDTVTPVKIAFFSLFINIVLNIILMFPLKVGGLALATSISGFVNLTCLLILLREKIGHFDLAKIFNFLIKIFSASLIMALTAYLFMMKMLWSGGLNDAINLILIILSSIAIYLGTSMILKIEEVRMLFAWMKKD